MGTMYRNQKNEITKITNALNDITKNIQEIKQKQLIHDRLIEDLTGEIEKCLTNKS